MPDHTGCYDDSALDSYIDTACEAADRARQITRKWFRSDFDVRSKQDNTPVTIADQQAEEAIRDVILGRHPDHGFFGEETGRQGTGSEWQWIIDPIDGTKCFATGMPTFGTLVSLVFQGKPVIGVIDHSILDERWIGVAGRPTTHNGRECRTRQQGQLSEASVYTTTVDMFDQAAEKRANALTTHCKFRVFGGDCYGYGLLASGFNDLVCEADLKPYDFFALIPVIEGAGGIITDWQGDALAMESPGDVLAAANRELHQQAIEKLNQATC